MSRIFISHTSDSRDYARGLRETLRQFEDASVLDEVETTPGQSIPEVILTRLRSTEFVVILLTEQAVESPWVMFEFGAASGLATLAPEA